MKKLLKFLFLVHLIFMFSASHFCMAHNYAGQSEGVTSQQLRFGIDLAWYVSGGMGSRHGVNGRDAKQLYNYLVHGHKNSRGAYGGYFTAISYTLRTPPSYPPDWQGQKKFALDLLAAADADDYGQRCKIILKLQPLNAFDDTFYGMVKDLLKNLGPAQNHPSLLGFAIRGMAPGIYTGGGPYSGGVEGAGYIPSTLVFGSNMPSDQTSYFAKWNQVKSLINAFGYNFGWSAGATPLEYYVSPSVIYDSGDIFINWVGPSRDADPISGPEKTYTKYYDGVSKPPSLKSIGCVGGMWENQWYIPNISPYYITKEKFEMAFKGFKDASSLNPKGAGILMFYGMPVMTDDDANFYNTYGHCPYIDWWLDMCNRYGFMTDYVPSPPPAIIAPVTPPAITYPPYPTGIEVTLEGDPSVAYPSYSQTRPQYADSGYTYRLFGQAINLADGRPVVGKAIDIYYFDFSSGTWKTLLYSDGTPVRPVTGSDGKYRSNEIPSPTLPPTPRQQMWYYPKLEADSTYLASEGVREDLPILPSPSPPPSQQWTLTVGSNLSSVPVTVDGITAGNIPVSVKVAAGVHTVAVPSNVGNYNFLRWEDGTSNPSRTINLAADMTLTAYYEVTSPPPPPPSPPFFLAVNSSPIVGVFFDLDASRYETPYSTTVSGGSHTITMPSSVTVAGITYNFRNWEDGSTNPVRTINLTKNMTITAYYKSVPPHSPPSPSPPPPPHPSSCPPVNDAIDLTNPSVGAKGCLAEKQAYVFQVKVTDLDGVVNLNYVDLTLDPAGQAIGVRWTEGMDAWSEENDPNDYVALGECSRSISGTQVTLNFAIVFRWTYPDKGVHSVRVYSLDDNGLNDTDDFANIYYVKKQLAIQKPSVSDIRVNPSQIIAISGCIYYEDTSIYPPDGDYQVKVKLLGVQKGLTNTTLISGHYTITIPAELTVGSYIYQISCNYNASTIDTPLVIVDKLKLSISANAPEVSLGTRKNFTIAIQVKDQATNTPISGASVHIKDEIWMSETKYTNASGWANFINVEVGTYTIVGEAKGYATALDTVSVTTDITYTLLLSKRALQLAVIPLMSPDFALILMAASAFSAFSALGHFMFQRKSKR